MLKDYTRARGLPTLPLFHQAHQRYGLPGDDPLLLHEIWKKSGILPLSVMRLVNDLLREEDTNEQPWLPFV